ncbi:DUF3472 domain-containing protein [Solitalea sp. MAHUQ-68]|uniref:DUF3472 domain-containing protein n=1 Tax=Solitalea agri TaxID=2953739 RepID=A0A9X2F1G5_9SPHI|nr:DUF3472 domain-containing protein [Solitalea agri]MCO4292410.1 DUF3472 domain-containing protein [Solitalea agri]
MKILTSIRLAALVALALTCTSNLKIKAATNDPTVSIPLGGNAWVTNNHVIKGEEAVITDEGIVNWKSAKSIITSYVYVEKPGVFDISLKIRVKDGVSKIKLEAASSSTILEATNHSYDLRKVSTIGFKKAGYYTIKLQGITKTGETFAEVSDIILSGTSANDGLAFTKNNDGNYFHWGRRGPSVHLNYNVPETAKDQIEWFYSEITVPKGKDPIGSYYMANGFKEGYFGIQVNSPTERRVLFSVWSPFHTDDPKSIPDSMKIVLLKKGMNVRSGEFGNEGSGGQSYMRYNWEAGKTYKFLTHVKPVDQSHTEYTSYFFDVEHNKWLLLASFKRPQTHTYLKSPHSFLENFDPNKGNVDRLANYGNQWVRDVNGKWYEITEARLSGDATARNGYRRDFAGGLSKSNASFYMRNGGFFNESVALDQKFTRKPMNKTPNIDFNALP